MKNRKLLAITGLTAVVVVGGSLAYFNQTMTVENPFDTNKYASELVETFNPTDGDNWQPGTTVNKDIEVKNTGSYDIITRVRFDETWTRKGEDEAYKTNNGMDNNTNQVSSSDGIVDADGSIVTKTLAGAENWVYNDGYWYYKKNLKPGENTGTFLDSVKLLEDADMGKYVVKKYYTTANKKPVDTQIGDDPSTDWVEYTEEKIPEGAKHTRTVTSIDEGKKGYSDSNYRLTITAQTVQATKEAVNNAFGIIDSIEGTSWTLTE